MKKKSILTAILVLVLSIVCCLGMIGCELKTDSANLVVFMFKNGDAVESISIDASKFKDKETIYNVIKSTEYSESFNANITEGQMPFLNSIHGIKPDGEKHQFVGVYSTLIEFKLDDKILTVNSVNFYSSSKGIGELPLVKGATYMFSLECWDVPAAA